MRSVCTSDFHKYIEVCSRADDCIPGLHCWALTQRWTVQESSSFRFASLLFLSPGWPICNCSRSTSGCDTNLNATYYSTQFLPKKRKENVRMLKDVSFHKPENCCCADTCGVKCCMPDHTPYHSSCQWQNSCCDITGWDTTSIYSIFKCRPTESSAAPDFCPLTYVILSVDVDLCYVCMCVYLSIISSVLVFFCVYLMWSVRLLGGGKALQVWPVIREWMEMYTDHICRNSKQATSAELKPFQLQFTYESRWISKNALLDKNMTNT